MSQVVLVPTGTANVASVRAALRRLGTTPLDAAGPDEVAEADQVVVPGVGAFGSAMGAIDAQGMRSVLDERIKDDRPTLAVCVGMQLLCSGSSESPGVSGLGVVEASLERFADEVRVPQLGWNQVVPGDGARFVEPGWAYFANSYRLEQAPDGWVGSWTEYGGRFVSAMERGAVLACQFHPELSGQWGADVLWRWLEATS